MPSGKCLDKSAAKGQRIAGAVILAIPVTTVIVALGLAVGFVNVLIAVGFIAAAIVLIMLLVLGLALLLGD